MWREQDISVAIPARAPVAAMPRDFLPQNNPSICAAWDFETRGLWSFRQTNSFNMYSFLIINVP
jgi:hypothetical protein